MGAAAGVTTQRKALPRSRAEGRTARQVAGGQRRQPQLTAGPGGQDALGGADQEAVGGDLVGPPSDTPQHEVAGVPGLGGEAEPRSYHGEVGVELGGRPGHVDGAEVEGHPGHLVEVVVLLAREWVRTGA